MPAGSTSGSPISGLCLQDSSVQVLSIGCNAAADIEIARLRRILLEAQSCATIKQHVHDSNRIPRSLGVDTREFVGTAKDIMDRPQQSLWHKWLFQDIPLFQVVRVGIPCHIEDLHCGSLLF
jgi:hypothetical protein